MTDESRAADGGRILGVDLGRRRTGLALSDPGATLATPLETLTGSPPTLLAPLAERVAHHGVVCVVFGFPRLASGDPGEIAGLARRIGDRLAQRTGVTVVYWDEALTSWEAERILAHDSPRRSRCGAGAGGRRAQRRAGEVDRLAAALMLQDYLDTHRQNLARGKPGTGEQA